MRPPDRGGSVLSLEIYFNISNTSIPGDADEPQIPEAFWLSHTSKLVRLAVYMLALCL